MTLEAAATFLADAALRANGFGAGLGAVFRDFGAGFGLADFFAAALTGFLARGREEDFVALARFALGLAVVAFATRFAVLPGAPFDFERAADRRKPFARLLLMVLISKRLLTLREQPRKRRRAYHRPTTKSTETTICGCVKHCVCLAPFDKCNNKEKSCWPWLAMLKCELA